jgi:hypothetical protein
MTASVGPAVGRGDGDQAATDKGLKAGALGLLSSVVIGVASTAPAYSLAATLGFVVLAVGLHAPAIMLIAFVPMPFIAIAYQAVYTGNAPAGSVHPSASWFNPFAVASFSAFTAGLLLAIFIYWAWERPSRSTRRPPTATEHPVGPRSCRRCCCSGPTRSSPPPRRRSPASAPADSGSGTPTTPATSSRCWGPRSSGPDGSVPCWRTWWS